MQIPLKALRSDKQQAREGRVESKGEVPVSKKEWRFGKEGKLKGSSTLKLLRPQ